MGEKGYSFISYSSKDSLFIADLVNILKGYNIAYWKAPEMIPAGSNYAREIPKAIRDCDVFLLVISEASQDSIWVEKEVDVAICYRKKIIPIKIDNVPLSDMYRFYLNNVQIVDVCVKPNEPIPRQEQEKLQAVFMQYMNDNHNKDSKKQDEKPDILQQDMQKAVDTRSNALRINKIPLQCEYCGGPLGQSALGVYKCMKCGRENYDDFRKIRNFLEQVGAAPAAVIAKNTGVSMKTIEYFRKNDFIVSTPEMELKENKGVWHSQIWKK